MVGLVAEPPAFSIRTVSLYTVLVLPGCTTTISPPLNELLPEIALEIVLNAFAALKPLLLSLPFTASTYHRFCPAGGAVNDGNEGKAEGLVFSTVVKTAAEQLALVPPLLPAQPQVHGPDPLTEEAVPVAQRSADGLLTTLIPFVAPQAPLTATALQVGAPVSTVVDTGLPCAVKVPLVHK